MLECTVTQDLGIKWVSLRGRMDSLTSPDAHRQIGELIQGGERSLVIELERVDFLSSAGLRIFMDVHKRLAKVGGQVVFYNVSRAVGNVFDLAGLTEVFRIVEGRDRLESLLRPQKGSPDILTEEIDGISFHYLTRDAEPGTLSNIGSQDKLASSEYGVDDVISVDAGTMRFGAGLATLGGRYDEYRDLFGEAMVVDGNFFFYPAVKRPAVDFVLESERQATLQYQFLHGFGFTGSYGHIVSFESEERFPELNDLVEAALRISGARLIGVVLLAESKGFWGMHLKQSPIVENKPPDGKGIFDAAHFSSWMDFPVEPSDINHVIVGAGIAARDVSTQPTLVRNLLAENTPFHMHAGVFAKEPIGKRIDLFEDEVGRVLTGFDVLKVQHVLGRSRFSFGMMGIVEIDH